MTTELYIENNLVDMSADISSLLTFALDDVKDFATRQTTFSKTVVLPGTANNNNLFGNIFDTGQANFYDSTKANIGYNFNASKSAKCLIFQDNLQTFKGTMRMLEIIKDNKGIEYEVALNGELTSLNIALTTKLLTDLDFSAYNTVYNAANITSSWDNPPGSGVYFPLMDYGNMSTAKHNWPYKAFRPALYVKEYIDKMFANAGFRYTCDLFNTARFKGLVIPHSQKSLTRSTTQLMNATRTNLVNTLTYSGVNTASLTWETFSSSVFTNTAFQTFKYTDVNPLNTTAKININFEWRCNGNTILLELKKNGTTISSKLLGDTGGMDVTSNFWNVQPPLSIVTNDVITITATVSDSTKDYNFNFKNGTFDVVTSAPVLVAVALGDTIKINDTIPKNVRQIDFLTSIVKLFNLYVFESQFDDRNIQIMPFVNFYSTSSSNAVDWTYKLNRDSPIRIRPMSEINSKYYNFRYKDDSDYHNTDYKKRYNQGYGSYIFNSNFEFSSQSNDLELVFAATPLVGYSGEDKVYSTIFKRSGTTEESIDSVIRILQTKKVIGVTSWNILDDGGLTLLANTNYGYAGHLDNPDNPSNDLNFGALNELYFTLKTGDLTKTQFNVYWSSYMAEITDKDSKLLKAKFYLTPKDIFNLDFSKYVYVDGVLFRLVKITDYNTNMSSDCEVQLIKVLNTIY